MRLVIGSDHAGWPLKQTVIDHIRSLGHDIVDVGSHDDKPVDFPDIARAVAQKVTSGEAARGIMVCGTGVGASIAANRSRLAMLPQAIRRTSATMTRVARMGRSYRRRSWDVPSDAGTSVNGFLRNI